MVAHYIRYSLLGFENDKSPTRLNQSRFYSRELPRQTIVVAQQRTLLWCTAAVSRRVTFPFAKTRNARQLADIQTVARKYLNAGAIQVVAVGDASKIKTCLEKYGAVEVSTAEAPSRRGR